MEAFTPGGLAAAKELIRVKGADVAFVQSIIGDAIEIAKNELLPANPNLTGPLNEIAAQLRKEYGEPKRAEVLDLAAKVYATYFNERELKGIIAFYRTPTGRKMLATEPLAADAYQKALQRWTMQFSNLVLRRFRAEMQKKG